jgi:predicted kinase
MFVLVTGPPASGKTTVSTELARALGAPRFAKDTIKRGLLAVLGADGVDASRRVGAADVEALLEMAGENQSGVLDSVWVRPDAVERLRALPGPVVEVFCECDLAGLRKRYVARADQRHGRSYDFDLERPEQELWNEHSLRPLNGGWPVIRVNTARAVDVPELANAVQAAVRDGVDQ